MSATKGRRAAPHGEILLLFLRFGCTAFGGPLAHTALFEQELVERRRWMSRERFLERIALTQLIPGPNSTELAMHLGYERGGWPGFLIAGLSFIAPAAVLVALLAQLYRTGGGLPEAALWIRGTGPVVGALMLLMLWRLGKKIRHEGERRHLLIGASGYLLHALGAPLLSALLLPLAPYLLWRRAFPGALFALVCGGAPFAPLETIGLLPALEGKGTGILLQMTALGSLVFGSGYVLYSFFSRHLVERLHWIPAETLVAAIAAGQLTPGPLFSSATFIGQVLDGPRGALLATIGIFAPAFFFGALSIPFARRLESSPLWTDAMRILSVSCVLLLAQETGRLLPALAGSPWLGAILLAALLALRSGWNPALLLVLGALAGRWG